MRDGLPIKSFFNVSELKYKELRLKDKIPIMSEDNNMRFLPLFKCPLLVGDKKVIVEFKENE